MTLDDATISAVATRLADAERTRRPVAPITTTVEGFGADDAYATQLANITRRIAEGEVLSGHKVGLTSRAMQVMLGVDEPDYGHLFASMLFTDGEASGADRFLQPRVEVEIAFRLSRPLAGPGITIADVMAATDSVAPSIEIIDSRIADWKITLFDTIADNASSAGVVLGAFVDLASAPDLAAVEATLVVNGLEVAAGRGSDVLGHPAAAVAWLANKFAELGETLPAGDIVMPGSCTKAIDIHPGDRVVARFAGLGEVGFTVAPAPE